MEIWVSSPMNIATQKWILYIDGSQDNHDLMSFILGKAGYGVELAYSLNQGLEISKERKFSLYIVDLFIYEESGFEFIQKIRQSDGSTPILACSSDVRQSTQKRAIQMGAQLFLRKPIEFNLLVEFLNDALNENM
jgi:CheY-like chemotaxis protein